MKKSKNNDSRKRSREQKLEIFRLRLLVDTPNKKNPNSPSFATILLNY